MAGVQDLPRVLLTGAGFTHNFGAPLAGGLWAMILNRLPDGAREVRRKMLSSSGLDFEDVYQEVMGSGTIEQAEKVMLVEAVGAAFEEVDAIILAYRQHQPENDIDLQAVNQLIDQFRGSGAEPGLFFTLNQDLYVERVYVGDNQQTVLPGLPGYGHLARGRQESPLKEQDLVRLPSAGDVQAAQGRLADQRAGLLYVKVHGSQHWISESGEPRMVLGKAKSTQIVSEPLLDWYFKLFEEALLRPGCRLLVIGYGFRDLHVNDVLKRAARQGLRMHILSPTPPTEMLFLRNGLDEVWQRLGGYYQCDFRKLFWSRPGLAGRPEPSREREELYRTFFGKDAPRLP